MDRKNIKKMLSDAFEKIMCAIEVGRSATNDEKKNIRPIAEELVWRHWCWVQKLNCEQDYHGRFIDLIKYIDNEVWVELASSHLSDYGMKKFYEDSRLYGKAAFFLVVFYMAWEAAKEELKLDDYGLPHPYYPFIWLLEKGAFMFDYEYVTFYTGPGARGIRTTNKDYFLANGPFVKEDEKGNLLI